MKTIIYTLLFLLIGTSFHVNSQNAILSTVYSDEQKITNVKAIKSKYYEGRVYLHITVNGNTETQILAVERSLDAINYEVIGYITIAGVPTQMDLAYYFTDKSPVVANLYYRLSNHPSYNEQVYSETISVTPIDDYKTPSGNIATAPITPICTEETNSSSGASK
jgi:hypothetical protein